MPCLASDLLGSYFRMKSWLTRRRPTRRLIPSARPPSTAGQAGWGPCTSPWSTGECYDSKRPLTLMTNYSDCFKIEIKVQSYLIPLQWVFRFKRPQTYSDCLENEIEVQSYLIPLQLVSLHSPNKPNSKLLLIHLDQSLNGRPLGNSWCCWLGFRYWCCLKASGQCWICALPQLAEVCFAGVHLQAKQPVESIKLLDFCAA